MTSDNETIALLSVISTLIHVLLYLGLGTAFVVIAATTVRRYRTQAMGWVLAYGIGVAALAILGPLAHSGSSAALAASGSMDAVTLIASSHLVGVVLTLLHVLNAALLATGIVKLARPSPSE